MTNMTIMRAQKMDINFRILKDAVEAVDRAIDAIGKLGQLINSAVDRGAEIISWRASQKLKNHLSHILGDSIRLIRMDNLPLLELLAADLDYGDLRSETLAGISSCINNTRLLLFDIEIKREEYVAKEFYSAIYSALCQRAYVLRKLEQLKPVSRSNELALLGTFVERYTILVSNLEDANKLLAAYIVKMESENKWPKASKDSRTD
jgi:hypothetical protein